MYPIIATRDILADFTHEELNLSSDGAGTFSRKDEYRPEKSFKKKVKETSRLEKLIGFIDQQNSFNFHAENVFDGMNYSLSYDQKEWTLFCPEYAEEEKVRQLGELLDELFEEYNHRLHSTETSSAE